MAFDWEKFHTQDAWSVLEGEEKEESWAQNHPIIETAVTIALAGAIGYGLFRVISPDSLMKPIDFARKWLAWMVFICTISTLPRFFKLLDLESFARFAVVTLAYGFIAFSLGWIYGKVFGTKRYPIDDPTKHSSLSGIQASNHSANKTLENQLTELKNLFEKQLITQEEYESKKGQMLEKLI